MAPGEEMSWEAATSAWEGFMVNYRIKEERFPRMRIIDTFLLFTVVRANPACRSPSCALVSLAFAGDGAGAAAVLPPVRVVSVQRLPGGLPVLCRNVHPHGSREQPRTLPC